MAKLAELRKEAKDLGSPKADIIKAKTPSALQAVIDAYGEEDEPKVKKTAKKKAHKKSAPAKKSGTRKSVARGATAAKGKAKRPNTKKASPSAYVPKGGRNLLADVDFTDDEGWNARPGSAPDRIAKALRKFKGNREKVFDFLSDDVWEFVGKKKRNGEKRTKGEAEEMLRYRIARTAWDFALRTGQHEKAENRVEYGTGDTGNGTFKRAKKATKATKATAAPKKRGRPAGSKNKTTATKARGKKLGKGKVKAGKR
jgi:hypothetical protein